MGEKEKAGPEKEVHETKNNMNKSLEVKGNNINKECNNNSVATRLQSNIKDAYASFGHRLIPTQPLALSTQLSACNPTFFLEPMRICFLHLSTWTHV